MENKLTAMKVKGLLWAYGSVTTRLWERQVRSPGERSYLSDFRGHV